MDSDTTSASPEISSIRAKALSAAAHILATRGVDKLSLRAIAKMAGIGIASIYHYFANKEELLLNLSVTGFGDLHQHIVNFLENPEYTSPMQASARAFFDFAETRPALFSLMFSERSMARHANLREAEHKTFLLFQAAVEADGRIPSPHQEDVSLALWALGRGMVAIISSYPDGKIPSEIMEKLFAGAAYLVNHPK